MSQEISDTICDTLWKRVRIQEHHESRELDNSANWNATPPTGPTIRMLPSELILNIFQFEISSCREEFLSPGGSYRTPRTPYSWLRLMRVCKYWRELIQSSSELWSDVVLPEVLSNLDCMQETLRYSANAPLRIHAPSLASVLSSRWHAAQVLKYIMVLSPRVQTLDLLLSDHLNGFMKDSTPQVNYSNLEKLKISNIHS